MNFLMNLPELKMKNNIIPTYTLNKLQMYDECPQKYKLCYIDKVHIVESISYTATGNNLHNIINHYLKGNDVTRLVEALGAGDKLLWFNFKNSDIKNYKIVKSEYPFNLKVDEYWLAGRIDALFEFDDNYIIADWKTGTSFAPEHVKFQTTFYLLCMYEILKIKKLIQAPEQLSMQYFNLAANSKINITFNQETYMLYRKQILEIIKNINENTNFYCNKTPACKKCKYYRVCPYL